MFKQCPLIRQTLIAFIGLAVLWRIGAVPYVEADDKHERKRRAQRGKLGTAQHERGEE